MIKVLAISAAVLAGGSACAQQKINKTALHHPESVATDGHSYYIADIGKAMTPDARDGDGMIWKMSPDGKIAGGKPLATGFNAPKGIAIVGKALYFTDIDHVRGIDLKTGRPVRTIDLSSTGSAFLNDLARKDDTTLLVTSTDRNKIYIIYLGDTAHVEELIFSGTITGANGICYHAGTDRVYVNGVGTTDGSTLGEIGYIDLNATERKLVPATERRGMYDGIAMADDHTLIVSDWVAFGKKGQVLRIDLETGKETVLNTDLISGSADFTLDGKGNAIIPEMIDGNLLKLSIR